MNTLKLAAAFVARKPLTWAFHVLTLALGVGVVVSVVLLAQGLDRRFARDLGGVDLVVGAKGSPLQIIMSSLFAIDVPNGNIPLPVAERLSRHPLVAMAVPVSLGDNVHGLRIVGTKPQYALLYDAEIARGRYWSQPMEVVLGAQAARELNADIGVTFIGQHGLSAGGEMHSEFPYKVVGVLAPTGAVIDRLVLTDSESVWRIHEHEAAEVAAESGLPPPPSHEREVTALLIRYKSAMGAIVLPRLVKQVPDIQAAVPALEAARLNVMLGTGADVLRWFGIGLLVLSGLGFFVALFSAVQQRQRELALLRILGAGPGRLFALITIEAVVLGLIGGALGIALGRAAASLAATMAAAHGGPLLALPAIGPIEALALAMAGALSLLASLAPGVLAYHLDPAKALKEG